MSVRDRQPEGGWQDREPEPSPSALDPNTWVAAGRLGEALADIQARLAALEGEVTSLRSEVLDLRAQRT